jgi:glutathione synthase/RimK-type ligase-like ATP-grasp enzyme
MNLFNKKTFTLLIFALGFMSLTACQNTQLASKEASSAAGDSITTDSITTDSIAAAQSTADAANIRANEAFQAAQTARRVAERGVEMANQNQAALRALNDKIDRMFETISRK